MSYYDGPAKIQESDGTEHQVTVQVQIQRAPPQRLGTWSGRVTSDLNAFHLIGHEGRKLVMPDGRSGLIIITRNAIGTHGSFIEFQGSGEPPL